MAYKGQFPNGEVTIVHPILAGMMAFTFAVAAPAAADPRIVTEGIVDGSVTEVWWAWTTSEGLQAWLAPHAEIELRPNGPMRTNYGAEARLDDPTTIVNEIVGFESGRQLTLRVRRPPKGFPFPTAVQSMRTTIYLDAIDAKRTKVKIVGEGFGEDKESKEMQAFFDKGNAFTLTQLQRYFAGRRSAP